MVILVSPQHIPQMTHSMRWRMIRFIMRLLDPGTMKVLIQETQNLTGPFQQLPLAITEFLLRVMSAIT